MINGKTSIIVPTYNQEDSTIRCFGSVRNHTDNYSIIWVDNGSTEESARKVKFFLDENNIPHKLIKNKNNLGFIKAINQGIRESLSREYEYIVFMNNDIEVYSDWLEKMKLILIEDERHGIVGPLSSSGTWMQSIDYLPKQYPDIFYNIPEYKNNPEEYSQLIRKKYTGVKREIYNHVAFFCTLLKRSTIEDVGYLEEELGIGYFDDNDYCERALRKGWKIFICADVFVLHCHGKTFKSKFTHEEKMKLFEKNKDIFEKKFCKGKYMKPIDEIENIEELRLEIKRLQEIISKSSFNKVNMANESGAQKENRMYNSSKFWKVRNFFISYKNKFIFVFFHPVRLYRKYQKLYNSKMKKHG